VNRKKINVAITGLNNVDSPGPGIPVIRGLLDSTEFDVRIIGLSYDALEPGIYMHDLVNKTYQIPLPSAGIKTVFDRIKQITEQEKIDVLIPNFDAELFNFIKMSEQLETELGIKTFLPTLQQFEERHKSNLNAFGDKYGIKVPKSKMIYSINEIPMLFTEFSYPLVVKGKFYDASIAYNQEQAISAFGKIATKWGLPIIIQQYTYGTEVNVTALGDGEGNTIGAVPMRKTFITDKGKAWAGITLDDDSLLNIAKKMIKKSSWKGPCELEMIKTNEGEYYLIEINPRFPAWVYLAVGAGQNHPEALLKMALGEKINAFENYEIGKMFIRYSYDMICDLKEFETISTMGEL
jgi:carbamoyl-phosphate synthase large subunit